MLLKGALIEVSPRHCTVRRLTVVLACAALSCSLIGCGSSQSGDRLPVFPATGKLVFDGRPLAGAYVVLHPKTAADGRAAPRPHGLAAADGSFALTSYESNDGAPAGDYAVTVELRSLVNRGGDITAGPNTLPAKYGKVNSTPLVVHIADESNELPLITIRK